MENKNELNDIILNKDNGANPNKKIILAVATLGIVLMIVIVVFSSMNSGGTKNLPQAVLPPKPKTTQTAQNENTVDSEPLFEDVEVISDDTSSQDDLDKITQKLKKESMEQQKKKTKPKPPAVKKVVKKEVKKAAKKAVTKTVQHGKYFVQVGSFSRYKPNKKFLSSIEKLGYTYKYHKVGKINKVLVGPFSSKKDATDARRVLRAEVEPGAFLFILK